MIILHPKTEQEQKDTFVKHMANDSWWKDDINRIRQEKKLLVVSSDEVIRQYGQRLICPKCERGAYRHGARDRARCNHCGWEGRSITIDEYMDAKLYKK